MTYKQRILTNRLSPTWFAKAGKAYFDASMSLEGGKETTDIRQNVVKARTRFKQSEEMATVSRTTLPEAIKAREIAPKALFHTEQQQRFGI